MSFSLSFFSPPLRVFYICHVYACYADDGDGNDYYMRRICYARWSIMTI